MPDYTSEKKVAAILFDVQKKMRLEPRIHNIWLVGSFASGDWDQHSSLDLTIRVEENWPEENLKHFFSELKLCVIGCNVERWVLLSDTGVLTQIFFDCDKDYTAISRINLLELNIEEHLGTRNTFTVIPAIRDHEKFKGCVEDRTNQMLTHLCGMAVALARLDSILIKKYAYSICDLIVETYGLIFKNGWEFYSKKISPFLNREIKIQILNLYNLVGICCDSQNLDKNDTLITALISTFNMLLYQYETSFGSFPSEKLHHVEDFFKLHTSVQIELAPKNGTQSGVYDAHLAGNYDVARSYGSGFNIGLEEMANRWFLQKSVLELGAGTGRIGMQILNYVNSYTGIELSQDMLNYFKSKLSKNHRCTLVTGDVMRLGELVEDKYDVIFEHEVLLFTLDPEKTCDEVLQCLKPNGLFLRLVLRKATPSMESTLLSFFERKTSKAYGSPFIVRGQSADMIVTKFLHKKGINTQKISLSTWTEEHSIDQFVKKLQLKPYPYLEDLSEEIVNSGLEEMKTYAYQKCPEGVYQESYELFCYVSRKRG